jgi:hypothetical protein
LKNGDVKVKKLMNENKWKGREYMEIGMETIE